MHVDMPIIHALMLCIIQVHLHLLDQDMGLVLAPYICLIFPALDLRMLSVTAGRTALDLSGDIA